MNTSAGRLVLILMLFSLFSCGELETLLPSNGSYQVRTLVNGNYLEDCSIIRSYDKIRPYFAGSVEDDPDLIGLLMYLQDSQGEVAGEKIRYVLEAYAKEPAPEKTEAKTGTSEEAESREADNETAGEPDKTISEEAVKNNAAKNATVEIAVTSLAQELPNFPLPKNMELGSYTFVFEALGKKDALSRMETNVFYLGNVEFNLKDISMYLPGLSGSQLILPETTVLLETRLDFDSRLNPYVVWYNGKTIIGEGAIRDGAGTILWKAPSQAGFYSLRMEVFPLQLKRNFAGVSREITLPVSPKAASLGYFFEKNQNNAARVPLNILLAAYAHDAAGIQSSPPELLRWYQFDGTLRDSLSPLAEDLSLRAINENNKKAPRWASAGQSYGLSTGSDDAYQLSPVNFFRKESDRGGGVFLFHIKPAAKGTIFNAFFPMQSASGVQMDMVKENNVITLRLDTGSATVEIPIYFDASEMQGLSPIAVEFYILPYRMDAKISMFDAYRNTGSIGLSGALTGECKISLGGESEAAWAAAEETDADMAGTQAYQANTIWDEFAVLFSGVPLLKEEFTADETNTDGFTHERGTFAILPENN